MTTSTLQLKNRWLTLFFFILILLIGCDQSPTTLPPTDQPTSLSTTPTTENSPPPTPPLLQGLVFSEILLGTEGNNNAEFIELYAGEGDPIDLRGYSISYKSKESDDEYMLYRWSQSTLVPPLGHYLLGREGQDLGLLADATFERPLSGTKGGLLLKNRDGEIIDTIGWGDAPDGFTKGDPVPQPAKGQSIERLPGGESGHQTIADHNAAEFALIATPTPQNTGSPITPTVENRLLVSLTSPATASPGETIPVAITVKNISAETAQNIAVTLPLDRNFEAFSFDTEPQAVDVTNKGLEWVISSLAPDETRTTTVNLIAPFTYFETVISGVHAQPLGWIASFAAPTPLAIAGGSIPIAAARTLEGSTVSVEGIATMYTGGFFAGSGTKFYISDESGGIQVYVPDGQAVIQVGDRVRVTGEIELYRDSLELIPDSAEIEIVASGEKPLNQSVSLQQISADDSVLGQLTTIEGTVTAIQEQTFDYLVTLTDDNGNTATALIEKQTGVTAEPLIVGERYRVTGISEFYSGLRQIKPRYQSDLTIAYAPELRLDVTTPPLANEDQTITALVVVSNHTDETLTNVEINSPKPEFGIEFLGSTSDVEGVSQADGSISYLVGTLAPQESVSLEIEYGLSTPLGVLEKSRMGLLPEMIVSADPRPAAPNTPLSQWENADISPPLTVWFGDYVPIYGIQGAGEASPLVRETVVTEGVVTGVFPELDGFWIQDQAGDGDALTSDGIFVFMGEDALLPEIARESLVQVAGAVREVSGQTTLDASEGMVETIELAVSTPITPTIYDPPTDVVESLAYKERKEGMLVRIEGVALAVGPTSRYGETPLVYAKWGAAEIERTDDVGYFIVFDDGSDARFEERSGQPLVLDKGAQVTELLGPLAFTFEQFKIEPIIPPQVIEFETALPEIEVAEGEIGFATFNVENLFDNRDPHPTGTYFPSKQELDTKLVKLTDAVLRMGRPVVIGLQEVENIAVLEAWVAVEGMADYVPYLVENPASSRGIDVAYLVREDVVTVVNVEAFPDPEGVLSRPPLVLTTEISGKPLVFLNNHFSSLASGEEVTEPRRVAQAEWNVGLMAEIQQATPETMFVMMGDLNSFYQTAPLNALTKFGLRHVYESIPIEEDVPYTYIFQGQTQSLDHILVSPDLFDLLTKTEALKINADFPLIDYGDISAESVSDHDPLIAIFKFP